MDDRNMKELESTLQLHKFAPKTNEPLSIDMLLEQIKAAHQKQGEDIAALEKRFQDALNNILDLSRIVSK